MVGTVRFKELVETIPDLMVPSEPLLVVRRALREQIIILHRRLLVIVREKRTAPTKPPVVREPDEDEDWTSLHLAVGVIISLMGWDTKDVALLKQLWAAGLSAAEIARRLGYSRNAVCGRLARLGLKRGHKPPTAKPKIRPAPKRRPALAACARPAVKKLSKPRGGQQSKEFSKRQLYDILAEAVRNTG